MASVIERELTCPICTDILFDPVVLLDCLHSNCGACAKRWFRTQQQPTCPVCRNVVRDARPNVLAANLLEDFHARNPDKARNKDEQDECRREYYPGDAIILRPAPGPAAAGGSAGGVPLPERPAQAAPVPLPTPPQQQHDLDYLANLLGHDLSLSGGAPVAYRPSPPPSRPRQHAPNYSLPRWGWPGSFDYLPPAFPPADMHLLDNPLWAGPAPPYAGPAPDERSQRVIDIIRRGSTITMINCDVCHRRVVYYMECAQCPMFQICIHCYRKNRRSCPGSTADGHFLTMQKVEGPGARYPPVPQVLCGIFCDICLRFCDEDRNNQRTGNSFFWHCESCNDSDWNYCSNCVARGFTCTHELKLYTNDRTRSSGPNNPLQGPDPAATQSKIREFIRRHPELLESSHPGEINVLARGYRRWTDWGIECDQCHRSIPLTHSYFSCHECDDGQFDMCTDCFFSHPSGGNPDAGQYLCPSAHSMSLLTQDGVSGTQKYISAPPRVVPEWICAEGTLEEPRKAIAVNAHWPEEPDIDSDGGRVGDRPDEGRKWGKSGLLCFPKNAEIENVVTAFEEASDDGGQPITHCWGWYAGIGGLFPKSEVRLV